MESSLDVADEKPTEVTTTEGLSRSDPEDEKPTAFTTTIELGRLDSDNGPRDGRDDDCDNFSTNPEMPPLPHTQSMLKKGPHLDMPSLMQANTLVYSPQETYMILCDQGIKKTNWSWTERTLNAVMGGLWISLAGHVSTIASAGCDDFPPGIVGLLYMALFPIALAAIMMTGGDLYTSNCMTLTIALLQRRVKWHRATFTLLWSLFCNFVGAIGGAFFFSWLSDSFADEVFASRIISIAEKKGHLEYHQAFLRGIPCNIFVCLSVHLYSATRDGAGKMIFVWFAIAAFGVGNFEHVVANAYTLSCGMMYGANVSALDFFWRSSFFVTLGNFVGGALFMAIVPWALYRRGYSDAWNRYQIDHGMTLANAGL